MIRLVATRLSPLIQGACSSVSRARFTIQQTCSMGEGSISSADENARTPNSADCNRLSSGSRLVRRVTQRNALHGHYCRRRRGGCQLYVGIDLRRWRFWDGYRRPWVQKSELAGNPYQLGTGSAPSLLDLTSKHLLGDLSDGQVERTLRVVWPTTTSSKTSSCKSRSFQPIRVCTWQRGAELWVVVDSVAHFCTRTLISRLAACVHGRKSQEIPPLAAILHP
jgi:hypothetical protein